MRTAMDMLNQFTRESSGEDAAAAVSNGDVPNRIVTGKQIGRAHV